MKVTENNVTLLEGELLEIGAVKNGLEVQADWTSSNTNWFEVVNGAVICLYGSAVSEIVADITATYNGESAVCKVKGWANSVATGTRFKIIEYNIGPTIVSSLEFVKGGVKQDFSTLTIFNSNPELLEINPTTGSFTMKNEGIAYVVCLFEGKRYATIIKSSATYSVEQQSLEEAPVKKTRKKS